jgi:hypothetical protein
MLFALARRLFRPIIWGVGLDGVVAQLAERLVRNEKVAGSIPVGSTIHGPLEISRYHLCPHPAKDEANILGLCQECHKGLSAPHSDLCGDCFIAYTGLGAAGDYFFRRLEMRRPRHPADSL